MAKFEVLNDSEQEDDGEAEPTKLTKEQKQAQHDRERSLGRAQMPEALKEARRVALVAALDALDVERAAMPQQAGFPNAPGPSDRTPYDELEDRKQQLRDLHTAFDLDRSGSIGRAELMKLSREVRRRLVRSTWGQEQSIDSLLHGMDADGDQGIDVQEFVSFLDAALPNDHHDFNRVIACFKEVATEATAENQLIQQTTWSRYLRSFTSRAQLAMLGLRHSMASAISGPGLAQQTIENIRGGGVKGTVTLANERVDDTLLTLLVAAVVEDGAAIEELQLTDNYITDAGASCLAEMFSHDGCHVSSLDVSGNCISEVGATELVAAAQGTLTELRLDRNQISEVKGIAMLVSGGGCGLQGLSLAENSFLGNESCTKALAQAVTENSTLNFLNVSPNQKLQQFLRNQFNKPANKREVVIPPTRFRTNPR